MPALFAYLIAVTVLLGGGYGALNWLATPEPVRVVAKATPKPPPPHYADNTSPGPALANAPQVSPSEPSKPEAPSKPEINGTDRVNATANDKAVSSDQRPSSSPSPQPATPVAASQQEAKAEVSDPGGSIGTARPKSRCLKPQPTRKPRNLLKRCRPNPCRAIRLQPGMKKKTNRPRPRRAATPKPLPPSHRSRRRRSGCVSGKQAAVSKSGRSR